MKVNLSFSRLVAASKDLQLWKIHSVPSVQCSTGPYTLRCHTNLIDIILNEQYQFVLTVRLQTDPVGGRLGQYCQMSDGLFSIVQKILKIKSMVKGWYGINQSVKTPNIVELPKILRY